jgi:site-specific DNA-methyltransferase (adenine-specific)
MDLPSWWHHPKPYAIMDCLEGMRTIPDNCIDAIVTDPPYGISFMGKKWDYDVPSVKIWIECLRILKPGGHLLAFAGTRTHHRMACRIEDAGFEIRDMIAWVYGSGFPKSLDIGKAVDNLQGNEREIVGEKPTLHHGTKDNVQKYGFATEGNIDITKGTSEWEGWGTALKPALEPITVARKPLSEKTVAENCLKWGVGGINIDGCRVESSGKDLEKLNGEWDREWNTDYSTYADKVGGSAGFNMDSARVENKGITGRFPANLIHDGSDEVVSLFPKVKTGAIKPYITTHEPENTVASFSKGMGKGTLRNFTQGCSDGSSARFFYCAKASKSERNKGCDGLEEKVTKVTNMYEMERTDGTIRELATKKNNHPTVKPIALMEYLIKLVSRGGAIVLDPFLGSGTTLIACNKLNRIGLGFDIDADNENIINGRLNSKYEDDDYYGFKKPKSLDEVW